VCPQPGAGRRDCSGEETQLYQAVVVDMRASLPILWDYSLGRERVVGRN